jgi:hypothetical protein
MRSEQSTEATVSTRIIVPVSRAFYLSAMAGVVIKKAHDSCTFITEIIDHLRNGTFDEAIMVSTFEDGNDCEIKVCIDGHWYLIEIH